MRSLTPERSEGDNRIRNDRTFMLECRMRFYNTTRLERAFEHESDKLLNQLIKRYQLIKISNSIKMCKKL